MPAIFILINLVQSPPKIWSMASSIMDPECHRANALLRTGLTLLGATLLVAHQICEEKNFAEQCDNNNMNKNPFILSLKI